jgi:AcrR family transcriptional regulator
MESVIARPPTASRRHKVRANIEKEFFSSSQRQPKLGAIYDATLAELREVGYLNLSMERVAQRARTGNASLYRRWASRAELVIDAVSSIVPEREEIPDTGSVRGDLLALLRQACARQAGPAGEVMRGVIAESLGNTRVHAARARLADQTLVEIVDQVMLPLVQASATEPYAVVNAATAWRVRVT